MNNSSINLPDNKIVNPQCVGIRPEDINFRSNDNSDYKFEGNIIDIIYHGQENEVIVNSTISKKPILIRCHKDQKLILNSNIHLYCANLFWVILEISKEEIKLKTIAFFPEAAFGPL